MAQAAANIIPSQSWVQRNLRVTPSNPPKCARTIELSSSDLEPIEATPASERRPVKPSPVRTRGAAIRALPAPQRVATNHPMQPVRVVELSSSDLEPIDTTPASERRLAKPSPLPKQSRPALASIRRFWFPTPIGLSVLLSVAATIVTLTFARTTDHSFITESEPAAKVTQDTALIPVTQKAHPVPVAKTAALHKQSINTQSAPVAKVTHKTALIPVTQKAHPVPIAKTALPRKQTIVRTTPATQKGRTAATKRPAQATVSSHRWTPANL